MNATIQSLYNRRAPWETRLEEEKNLDVLQQCEQKNKNGVETTTTGKRCGRRCNGGGSDASACDVTLTRESSPAERILFRVTNAARSEAKRSDEVVRNASG